MTKTDKENTEEKILEAAKKIFVTKGKDGARMQEIADEAGINKSLLHYYYRNKEKLFGAVFKFVFSKFAPGLIDAFQTNDNIFIKIEKFIHLYIEAISKNHFIPMFILNEVNKKNASFVISVIKNSGLNVDSIEEQINSAIRKGTIKPINPKNLIVNVLALCAFPYIGRPLLQVVIYKDNKEEYERFLSGRKKEVADMIINSISLTNKSYK